MVADIRHLTFTRELTTHATCIQTTEFWFTGVSDPLNMSNTYKCKQTRLHSLENISIRSPLAAQGKYEMLQYVSKI